MCADHVIDRMVTSSAHSVLAGITYGQRGYVLFNPRLNLCQGKPPTRSLGKNYIYLDLKRLESGDTNNQSDQAPVTQYTINISSVIFLAIIP